MNNEVIFLRDTFQMVPHTEGGYFKEMYISEEEILAEHLPKRFGGHRKFSASIYFMLAGEQFSALHRIKSDEMWHFYKGGGMTIYVIDETGSLYEIKLGLDFDNGEIPQAVVKQNCWFGAKVNDPDSYSFVGCTVAPGFHFDDFEMGNRKKLLELYPQYEDVIVKLTSE